MKPISKDGPLLRGLISVTNGLCKALHVPCPPVTFVTCEVEAPDGTIVHSHREKSNSWVRNLYNQHAAMFLPCPATTTGTYGAGVLRYKDTAGTTQNISAYGTKLLVNLGAIGDSARGIQVGTGAGAETFESTTLGALITHGTGAGQLSYQADAITAPSYDAGTKKWSGGVTRIFNNNSAGAITVTEVGWVGNNGTHNILEERSLLDTPVTVPAAYKLTVTYTTEYTFPA